MTSPESPTPDSSSRKVGRHPAEVLEDVAADMADVKRAVASLTKTVNDLYLRGERLGRDDVAQLQSTVAEMHATMQSLEQSPALKWGPRDYAKEIRGAGRAVAQEQAAVLDGVVRRLERAADARGGILSVPTPVHDDEQRWDLRIRTVLTAVVTAGLMLAVYFMVPPLAWKAPTDRAERWDLGTELRRRANPARASEHEWIVGLLYGTLSMERMNTCRRVALREQKYVGCVLPVRPTDARPEPLGRLHFLDSDAWGFRDPPEYPQFVTGERWTYGQ